MKSPVKILSVLFLLFLGNIGFANTGELEFTIKNTESKTLYFEATDLISQPFEVQIQDKDGKVVFSEYVVNGNNFERNYNLNELPNGEYFFVLVANTKTQVLPIWVETSGLKIELEKLEEL
jgi:hypothetical protein